MVLESTIVCVDNSEYMRNGDFMPTRIQAQQDAVSLVCHAKTRQNPENNVALMTSASLEVLVTLTTDVNRVLSKLHQVNPSGKAQFSTGIKIAHLALKHRQGKNHRMRIIAFVGSPIDSSDKDLVRLAKKLKKEKVNVDVIALGEDSASFDKLSQFVDTLNGKEGTSSHLVVIPPGPSLSDALRTSAVLQGEDGYMPSGDFSSGGFDVDANLDPELALALRVSMEEQRARQEEESKSSSNEVATGTSSKEDSLLMNAMFSRGSDQPVDFNAMTEEEQIAMAIQMSMSDANSSVEPSETPTLMDVETDNPDSMEQDYSAVMNDPAFLQHLVGSLPGVDPNSEAIQNALHALTSGSEAKKDNESKDEKNKEK
ncbi:26S proteasome non-ATPase regulatory subunit 4 [Hydra vulgaris]|uniref:26S proteasome non-ATPase regulatory subunit 4 n=1 Tax=Hydra vulgaris TaxID=6087 RepID=T2MF29_HYDVU|nr:26S proteasome non-ATPase regulatory subunit 4 [Hydra vulgaris]